MTNVKKNNKHNAKSEDISRIESDLLKSYFKDMAKQTERETARFRPQPDIDRLYTYVLQREKERKARFERILRPLKIFQSIAFTFIGILIAVLLWSKKTAVGGFFDNLFGIHRTAEKLSTGYTPNSLTIIILFSTVAMIILALFSYFMLKPDKSK